MSPQAWAVIAPITVAATLAAGTWAGRRLLQFFRKLGRAGDIILGTPAETDPLSGTQLRPPVPDIGTRMANAEYLLGEVVKRTADEAKAAAAAAARSAEAAAESAAAARDLMEASRRELGLVRIEVKDLSSRVDLWQGVDRVKADAHDAIVTELGLDAEIPQQKGTS